MHGREYTPAIGRANRGRKQYRTARKMGNELGGQKRDPSLNNRQTENQKDGYNGEGEGR